MKKLLFIFLCLIAKAENTPAPFLQGHTMGADFTSSVMNISVPMNFTIQCNWTGSPVGTFVLQGSIDKVNFYTILNSSVDVNGASGNVWNYASSGFPYVQVSYTFTSGSGSTTCYLSSKLNH